MKSPFQNLVKMSEDGEQNPLGFLPDNNDPYMYRDVLCLYGRMESPWTRLLTKGKTCSFPKG